uniref:trehalose-phosphatase n=1 Tax=Noccaea caerulescens TaxID=107243 RepID=A0A1J3HM38_NOCCA
MLSSSLTCPQRYDVFLSFRGKDTRRTLISFLYKELTRTGLRTFKDDMDLEIGRRISQDISIAIQNSKVAIVVVSVGYPDSGWCLDELVEIMDAERKGLIIVFPIFYDVEPSHLRRQIRKVAKQFKKHEEREDHQTVVSWRQALVNLADISGQCSRDWKDDSKLVEEITKRIYMLLFSTPPPSNNGCCITSLFYMNVIDEVFRTLVEKMKDIKGSKVENHKLCASVYYRNVDMKDWAVIAQRVSEQLKQYPLLRLTHGRKVLEVRPALRDVSPARSPQAKPIRTFPGWAWIDKKCSQNMRNGLGPIKFVRNPRRTDLHGRIKNIKSNGQVQAGGRGLARLTSLRTIQYM